MDTLGTVITTVRRRFPDLPVADAVEIGNRVHAEILANIPALRRSSVNINLTSGTREYTLEEYILQVDGVYYRTSSSAAVDLSETSIETLNINTPNWRGLAAGTPTSFYVSSNTTGGVIGLHPKPDTTTSAGFPILEVYGSFKETTALVEATTLLPTLYSSQIYVEGISFYASLDLRPAAAAFHKGLYDQHMAFEEQYAMTRNEGLKKGQPFPNVRNG